MKGAWGIGVAALVAVAAQPVVAASPREVVELTKDWRFRRGGEDVPTASVYDDRTWSTVSLPHTWNRIGSYTIERDPKTDAYQGVGWYRLAFASPSMAGGRRTFLEFDGVGSIAEVWLNGRRLGQHRGAFSRFRFEITDLLSATGPNTLAVRADNSRRQEGSPTADIIPLSGDFFVFGGIYRGVRLVTTGASHLDLMDHGGPGVYATTRSVTSARATIAVTSRIVAERPVTLDVSLLDAKGREVAKARRTVEAGEVRLDLDIARPHLWNGRTDPYLYRLRARIYDGGRLVDQLDQPYGIRDFRIDPEHGFFLNGRRLSLHGVSRHQDRLGKGWALDEADHVEDMALAQELGANTIRMAHYQHADTWFDLADRAGMVVWAEAPFVNQVAWRDVDASPQLRANAREQLTELIRQNQNRPGVVTWSVGNEVDIHARGAKWGNHSRALLDEMNTLARQLDPSRPTVFADCCEEVFEPLDPKREMLTGATDLVGYNRYYGWYYGKPDDLGPALDILHRRHPTLPLSISEYGAGGATSQHSEDPRGGPVAFTGRPQPEEYQSYIFERAWAAIEARPYVWASWVWNLADFVSNVRAEGDATDLNTKGLVTADRKMRKDGFYFLQAHWSATPVLHLVGRRYIDRAYPVTDVKAYANAPRARLALNGQDLGWADCPERICIWPGVRLAAGSNHLAVTDARGLRDSVAWTAPDPHEGLAIDAGALVGGRHDGHRFGSDAFFAGGEAKAALGGGLAASVRSGTFSYLLPLPAGRWRIAITTGADEGRATIRVADAPAQPLTSSTTQTFTATAGLDALTLAFADASVAAIVAVPER